MKIRLQKSLSPNAQMFSKTSVIKINLHKQTFVLLP